MPCGSTDPRRAGHRCFQCRKKHYKCDGKRPCSSCARRGFVCAVATPAYIEYSIVHYQPAPKIQNPLMDDSWRYKTIFFEAVGSPATGNRVFHFSLIGALSQCHEQIDRTLAVVGGVYAAQNSHLLELPQAKRRDIRHDLAVQKQSIWDNLALWRRDHENAGEFIHLLLGASLLALAELLIDRSGDHWRAWIRHIAGFIVQNWTCVDSSDPLHVEILQNFRLKDVLGALSRRELPSLPSHLILPTPPWTSGDQPSPDAGLTTLLEDLESWAVLQCRAQSWMEQSPCRPKSLHPIANFRSNLATSAPVNHRRKLMGLELVSEATALQKHIVSIVLDNQRGSESNNTSNFIILFYQWALVGLSQLFRHNIWSSLGCGLPNMDQAMSSTLAMTMLNDVAARLDEVQLEAVIFVPITDHSGIEMKTPEDREKVRDVLKKIKARGFEVTHSYERDLDLFWTFN